MNSDTFPIRILSGKTGVPSATIRAWERRYNILPAHRTASGHRYYNDDDALYVQQLLARMEQGKTISKAIREVDAWLAQGQVLKARVESTHNQQWQHIIDAMLEAVSQFDSFALDQVYQQALALYNIEVVTDNMLRPTLVTLGERWQQRPAGIAEEHFFSIYLRNKVGARLHHQVDQTGPLLVIACLPGERHELGSLIFALCAQLKGYRVVCLGADLPLSQLSPVVASTDAAGVVLSATSVDINQQLIDELQLLASQIDIPVMLGGNIDASLELNQTYDLGVGFTEALVRLQQII